MLEKAEPRRFQVYYNTENDYEYPKLAGQLVGAFLEDGRMIGGKVQLITKAKDIFDTLEKFFLHQSERLHELFDEFDVDGSGALDHSELTRLIMKLLPDSHVSGPSRVCV